MRHYYHFINISTRKILFLAQLPILCLLFLFIGGKAAAQSTDASISGKVTDEKGIAIPGASVVVRNESTGFRTVTSTNKEGGYALIQLPLGKPYTITVSYIGYPKQVK